MLAEPYIVGRVTDIDGEELYVAPRDARSVQSAGLRRIQEGLRGVVRIPGGTASVLNRRDFPVPVMGKTGTTSDFRDALFVGSTYGTSGITVAVRIGFDDNRPLGRSETGGRTALPVFREIMLRIYERQLVGPAPRFPRSIESRDRPVRSGAGRVEGLPRHAAHTLTRNPGPTMMKTLLTCALALMLAGAGCTKKVDLKKVPVGTEVQVTRQDGGVVQGTLAARDDTTVKVKVGPVNRSVPRDQIVDVQLVAETPAHLPVIAKFREFTIPAGTTLHVRLDSPLGSDSSRAGDSVEATLADAVSVDDVEVLPPGSVVRGEVAAAEPGGKVSGRASVALRFTSVAVAGRDERYPIATHVSWLAPTTKGKDTAKIAVPAGAGAIIGGIVGGKQGAAIGAAIGGGGGAAVVLTTRGPQIRLPAGAALSLPLDQSVDVRMPVKKP